MSPPFLMLSSSSWCQNTTWYVLRVFGIFLYYRSLEAPRLSDFLDVDLQLNNDNSKKNERFSYTVSSPSLNSVESKKRSRSKDL